jgi:uncharacterized membrane protein YfcA
MPWEWPAGALCAFLLALVTTPAGVSGAVLLLPVQLSVLGVPSPAVTPTNLVYNVAAIPGGLLRFGRERRLANPLTAMLVAGTRPGVIVGAILRVEFLADGRAFTLVAAGVLLPIGLWLLLAGQRMPRARSEPPTGYARLTIWLLSLAIGVIGGIYGIGGGSLLAPILLAVGFSAYLVAPATLAATFLTSIAGIATYQVLQLGHGGAIAPDWVLGAFLGAGGFAGSYLGARLQRRLPETALRRLLGLIACLIAIRYLDPAYAAARSSSSAASTRSSCFLGWTLGKTFTTLPSGSMMKVVRCTPMYLRPYIDFSTQTPYCSHTAWSSSARRVKSRSCLSANFATRFTGSGETPTTTAPAFA